MLAAGSEFRWYVARAGYRWVRLSDLRDVQGLNPKLLERKDAKADGWFLTEVFESPELMDYEDRYPLTDSPGLFREFAALTPDNRAAALKFASRHGLLETSRKVFVRRKPLQPVEPGQEDRRSRLLNIPLDPQTDWVRHPYVFRLILSAWEARKKGPDGLADLARLFGWEPRKGSWVARDADDRGSKSGAITVDPGPWETRQKGSWTGMETLAKVADTFICQEVTKGTAGNGGFELHLVPDPAGGRARFRAVPPNLLSAMFFQLGQVVEGNKKVRACKECGTWFELVPKNKGRKEFCSDACKMKEYRDRMSKARELFNENKTPEQIAEAVGTSLETVRGWLGGESSPDGKGDE